MKKTILSIVFISLGLLVLWGCSSKKEEKGKSTHKGAIVAKVGNKVITADELKQVITRHSGFYPGRLDKKMVLDQMIREDALVIKAKQLGLDKDPDVERRYRNILISKLKQKEIGQKLSDMKPADETLQSYYQKNIVQFTIPTRVHLAEIRLDIKPGTSDSQLAALKKKMLACREKALAQKEPGQGFGPLAMEYSQDPFTRSRGGNMGWFEEGRNYPRIDSAVLAAGFALTKPGQVSDIITTPKGLYLVKLMDRRPEKVIPFSAAKGRVRQEILNQKRAALEKQFNDEVLKSVKVETFPKVLESIKVPERPQGSKGMSRMPMHRMYQSMPGGMIPSHGRMMEENARPHAIHALPRSQSRPQPATPNTAPSSETGQK